MKKDREDYRFFRIWGDMNYRCNTPTCRAYKNYGARGIKVCNKWRHYQGFKEDMWGKLSRSFRKVWREANYLRQNQRRRKLL